MGLKANICQVCGGALKNCGTYYKCVCCDAELVGFYEGVNHEVSELR